ncbi:MAG: hypothetical protein EBR30_11965 [Cytophagia bacterium]|nr:hypothetical protein [Cytophagia bacterium]
MKLIYRCLMASAVAAFTLTSCSEDEVPKIGFTTTTSDVVEGSTLSIPLSVAIPSGVSPIVTLTGTATEELDFNWAVSADGRELVFETFADDVFDDETAIIEITGFNGDAAVGSTVKHTVNISDPGLKAVLTWTTGDGGSADLDLILLKETSPGSGDYNEIDGSFGTGTSETLVLRGDETNAKYAFGIAYYELGSNSDDVDFTLTLSTTAGTVNSNAKQITFSGSLTQYHITAELSNVILTKNNFNYSGFSNLFIDTPLEITLSWNAGNGTAGDVDMDLALYYLNPATGLYESIDESTSVSDPTETVVLSGTEPNGTYGLRYRYYDGTSNNLSFRATFALNEGGSFSGTANSTIIFNGVYTLSNKTALGSSNISQTFVKNGSTFSNFSVVSIPVSGSDAQFKDGGVMVKNKVSKARTSGQSIKREKGLKDSTINLNR